MSPMGRSFNETLPWIEAGCWPVGPFPNGNGTEVVSKNKDPGGMAIKNLVCRKRKC